MKGKISRNKSVGIDLLRDSVLCTAVKNILNNIICHRVHKITISWL